MKGKRSCLYTQNSLWVAIIGLLGQVLIYGNVIILWRKLLHLVTSGESMSVDNFATLSLLHSRTFSIYFWDASIQNYDVRSLQPCHMVNSKLSFKILSIKGRSWQCSAGTVCQTLQSSAGIESWTLRFSAGTKDCNL